MTKLNALATTLAAAATLAGCAIDPYAAKPTETAPQARTPEKASVTFGSTLCEAKIRANDMADMAKLKIARASDPKAQIANRTNLPSDNECLAAVLGVPGGKPKTEFHYAAIHLPNCDQGSSAVSAFVSQGLSAAVNRAGQAAGNGVVAQTGKRAAQEAVKGAQQPAKTPTTGISAACRADLSEAYASASRDIAALKTAYAQQAGISETSVQVTQAPTFDPRYWGPAPSKK